MKRLLLKLGALICFLLCLSSCNKDNNESGGPVYDPNRDYVLTTFYPDSGRIMEQVILEGDNFGSDPSIIKVYFNQKRAKVVGASGGKMYVIAPRLPGDTCLITVVIGKDSIAYRKRFLYRKAVTVTTIIGTGEAVFKQGNNLNEYSFKTSSISVDSAGNLYALVVREGGNGDNYKANVLKINEEDNDVVELFSPDNVGYSSQMVWVAGKMYIINQRQRDTFHKIDPAEGWKKTDLLAEVAFGDHPPANQWRQGLAYHEPSNSFYYLADQGFFAKTPLSTWIQSFIGSVAKGFLPVNQSPGMVFHPVKKDWLFMSIDGGADAEFNWPNGAGTRFNHSIVLIDVSQIDPDNPSNSVIKLNSDAPQGAGHMDGFLGMAQFRSPKQMCFDSEGNLYVADAGNNCIRKIYINTEMPEMSSIETIAGLPGQPAGFKDGFVETALFKNPVGVWFMNDILYVADEGNNRIRRVAVE